MRFSLLVSLLASLVIASNAHAATLNVVDGQLMGASNVLVDGSLYDVQFLKETCIELYNGCDDLSDFTFQTLESANLASQALLDQVFLDGPSGAFDSIPNLTANAELFSAFSITYTPWKLTPFPSSVFGSRFVVSTADAINCPDASLPTIYCFSHSPLSCPPAFDDCLSESQTTPEHFLVHPGGIYAVWSQTPIPEPTTALLLGLGLTAVATQGRRRNRS